MLKAISNFIKSFFRLLTLDLTKSANAIDKYTDSKYIKTILAEYKIKVNEAITKQDNDINKIVAKRNVLESELDKQYTIYERAIESLKVIENTNPKSPKYAETQKDKKAIMLEAKNAKRYIKLYEPLLNTLKENITLMREQIEQNRYEMQEVISELEFLAVQNDLLESSDFNVREVRIGKYDIKAIADIVNNKKALYEAKKENDEILGRNSESVVDKLNRSKIDDEIEQEIANDIKK